MGIPPEVVIRGTWDKGVLHGEAEITHRNKDRFVGNFVNGKKTGRGRVYYGNGSCFEG